MGLFAFTQNTLRYRLPPDEPNTLPAYAFLLSLLELELKMVPIRSPETLLPPNRKAEPRRPDSALSPACGDRLPLYEPPNSPPASAPKFGMTHVCLSSRYLALCLNRVPCAGATQPFGLPGLLGFPGLVGWPGSTTTLTDLVSDAASGSSSCTRRVTV